MAYPGRAPLQRATSQPCPAERTSQPLRLAGLPAAVAVLSQLHQRPPDPTTAHTLFDKRALQPLEQLAKVVGSTPIVARGLSRNLAISHRDLAQDRRGRAVADDLGSLLDATQAALASLPALDNERLRCQT